MRRWTCARCAVFIASNASLNGCAAADNGQHLVPWRAT